MKGTDFRTGIKTTLEVSPAQRKVLEILKAGPVPFAKMHSGLRGSVLQALKRRGLVEFVSTQEGYAWRMTT